MSFLVDVGANIVADLIIVFGAVLLGWLLISRRRHKLHNFFGITSSQPLLVYLSSLPVEPNTIKDRHGNVTRHQGTVISNYEFQTIPRLTSLLLSSPLDNVPEFLSRIMGNLSLERKPTIQFVPSPFDDDSIKFQNMLCIGGTLFNAVTDYYLRTGQPYLNLIRDPDNRSRWALSVVRGGQTGELIRPPNETEGLGMIQKLVDSEYKVSVFILAGSNVNGTRASVEYLIRNWSHLQKVYGNDAFAIAISCPHFRNDPDGYLSITELKRFPTIKR